MYSSLKHSTFLKDFRMNFGGFKLYLFHVNPDDDVELIRERGQDNIISKVYICFCLCTHIVKTKFIHFIIPFIFHNHFILRLLLLIKLRKTCTSLLVQTAHECPLLTFKNIVDIALTHDYIIFIISFFSGFFFSTTLLHILSLEQLFSRTYSKNHFCHVKALLAFIVFHFIAICWIFMHFSSHF